MFPTSINHIIAYVTWRVVNTQNTTRKWGLGNPNPSSALPPEVQIWRNWYTAWTTYVSQWRYRLVHSCDSTTLNSEHKKNRRPQRWHAEDEDDFSLVQHLVCRRRKITAPTPAEFLTAASQPELIPASRKWTVARLRAHHLHGMTVSSHQFSSRLVCCLCRPTLQNKSSVYGWTVTYDHV